MGFYPLANVYIAMENHSFLMGKSIISMGHVQVRKLLVITRGYP